MRNDCTVEASQVCAVIVTYNPDIPALREHLESLTQQCVCVVVDNGSRTAVSAYLSGIDTGDSRVSTVVLDTNTGIANAQNVGVDHARAVYSNIRFILFLDQDSVLAKDTVTRLVDHFFALERNGAVVAALGPMLRDARSAKVIPFHIASRTLLARHRRVEQSDPVRVFSLNSSGSLVSVDAIDKVGPFNAALFIDHVETDWCFRAQQFAYSLYGCPDIVMDHEMGANVVRYWLLGWRTMPYRTPERHYYLVRNSMFLQRRRYVPLIWKLQNIAKLMFTLIYFGFIGTRASDQRKSIFRGIRDGVTGRLGIDRYSQQSRVSPAGDEHCG